MDSRFHISRKHLLLARNAARCGGAPETIADHLARSGRELLLLAAGVPCDASARECQAYLMRKIQEPELQEVVRLMAVAEIFSGLAGTHDDDEEGLQRWRDGVRRVLKQMDAHLVHLAAAMNERRTKAEAVQLKGSAGSVPPESVHRDSQGLMHDII